MPNPIALLHLLMRMFRASQGVHTSPFGWFRELHAECAHQYRHYRQRSRRVRRYAERIPAATFEPGPGSGPGCEVEPTTGESPWLPAPERSAPTLCGPGPRIPAPRRPSDAAPDPSPVPRSSLAAGFIPRPRVPESVNLSVPAAIVRGRCFVTGRATGARPAESRKLALAVLCALADQDRAAQLHPAAPGVSAASGAPGDPGSVRAERSVAHSRSVPTEPFVMAEAA